MEFNTCNSDLKTTTPTPMSLTDSFGENNKLICKDSKKDDCVPNISGSEREEGGGEEDEEEGMLDEPILDEDGNVVEPAAEGSFLMAEGLRFLYEMEIESGPSSSSVSAGETAAIHVSAFSGGKDGKNAELGEVGLEVEETAPRESSFSSSFLLKPYKMPESEAVAAKKAVAAFFEKQHNCMPFHQQQYQAPSENYDDSYEDEEKENEKGTEKDTNKKEKVIAEDHTARVTSPSPAPSSGFSDKKDKNDRYNPLHQHQHATEAAKVQPATTNAYHEDEEDYYDYDYDEEDYTNEGECVGMGSSPSLTDPSDWVLASILKRRVNKHRDGGQWEYLCSWRGHEEAENNTWEAREVLEEAGYIPAVDAFDARGPLGNAPSTEGGGGGQRQRMASRRRAKNTLPDSNTVVRSFFADSDEEFISLLSDTHSRVVCDSVFFRIRHYAYMNPRLTRAFCARWRARQDTHVPIIVFHGTQSKNLSAIYNIGLVVGGTRGVTVTNGSANGSGVYSSITPSLPMCYAGLSDSVLLCVGLVPLAATASTGVPFEASSTADGGDGGVYFSGDVRVFRNAEDIVPLWVLHVPTTNEALASAAASAAAAAAAAAAIAAAAIAAKKKKGKGDEKAASESAAATATTAPPSTSSSSSSTPEFPFTAELISFSVFEQSSHSAFGVHSNSSNCPQHQQQQQQQSSKKQQRAANNLSNNSSSSLPIDAAYVRSVIKALKCGGGGGGGKGGLSKSALKAQPRFVKELLKNLKLENNNNK